ncbi:MAG: hypothetical protein JEZ05_09160 [Tenericutes bacterium]|nr:hypothetical protein [Mycoplasmatota bacterium]
MKKIMILIMFVFSCFLLFSSGIPILSASYEVIGSYNVIGKEDYDYNLELDIVKRSESFDLDDQKISFYMLGGDLVYQSDDEFQFIARDASLGFKIVFISPEAGRLDGSYSTKDFYPELNSILRILNVDLLTYKLVDDQWLIQIGETSLNSNLYYEEKDGTRTELKTESNLGNSNHFILNLENYSLSKEDSMFVLRHNFSDKSILDDIFADPGIDFKSSEIMFRTFESRLKYDSEKFEIFTTRKPSEAMIGQIIRFTGDTDDGANIAKILSVDSNNYKIYIDRVDVLEYNLHSEGTWLRCFNDYSNGQIIENTYPKISLSPTFWTIKENEFQSLVDTVTSADPTGLLKNIKVELENNDSFGYKLSDVTYSQNGLDFVGGMSGAFYIGLDFDFFGRNVEIEPIRIDYGEAVTSLTDELLRINTYKAEAFRFYFNPDVMGGYADFADMGSFNPPTNFPLKFRLYFDKEFVLIGGNVRINLPGQGIPLPGGLIYIDNIGGGYRYPQTFEVGANFTSFDANLGFPLWSADVEMELSIDQKYLVIDGSSWIFGNKVQIGDFDATVAWSYYTGKQFKGVELHGEVGVHVSKVDLIVDLTFKVKRYQSAGETKTYIGGKGKASVEAFGYTFGGVSVYANTKRFKASVEIPIVGRKSVYVYYADVIRNITQLSTIEANKIGVASVYDFDGNLVVLVPEAIKINQPIQVSQLGGGDLASNTLVLNETLAEAAITIDYSGTLDAVSVTLPNGTVKNVVIAAEGLVYDSDYLYAMDYEVEDSNRQLYIQLIDPLNGTYTVNYGATSVDDVSLYEIVQIPNLSTDLNASISGDTVTLTWDMLEENPDTRYHITLQELDDLGNVINEYPLFEEYRLDDESIVDNFLIEESITVDGLTNSLTLVMPSSIGSGNYQFVLEPVLERDTLENLSGEAISSTAVPFITVNPVSVPVLNSINYLGSDIFEFDITNNALHTSYNIIFVDSENQLIDTFTILASDLVLGTSLVNNHILVTTTIYNDVLADYYLTNLDPDTEYSVYVVANIEETVIAGDIYDAINDQIIIENILSNQNENSLTYSNISTVFPYTFRQSAKIYTEMEVNGMETGEVNTDPSYDTDYIYDPEDDSVDVEILSEDPNETVFRVNDLEDLVLLPNQNIERFALSIMDPSGELILSIPEMDLSLLFDYQNYFTFYQALLAVQSQYSTEDFNKIIALYNSNAISLEEDFALHIDLDALQGSGIMEEIAEGSYLIHLDMYNEFNDYTVVNYPLNISDFIPAVFIETMIPTGNFFEISGLVNGAIDLEINGVIALIENGYFTVTAALDTDTISYSLHDYFNNSYSGTIQFDDDLVAPTIVLSSYENITITEGETYQLPSCIASDDQSTDLICSIETNLVSSSEPGTYDFTFFAIDYYGNMSNQEKITLTINAAEDIDNPVDPDEPICNSGYSLVNGVCVLDTEPVIKKVLVIVGIVVGSIGTIFTGYLLVKKFIL